MYKLLILILNVLAIIIIYNWIRRSKKRAGLSYVRFFLHQRTLKYLLSFIGIGGLSFYVVNKVIKDPDLSSPYAKIEHYTKVHEYEKLSYQYGNILRFEDLDETAMDDHFQFVHQMRNHLRETYGPADTWWDKESASRVFLRYDAEPESDVSNLFKGLHFINIGREDSGKFLLDKVQDKSLKYYEYALGRYFKVIQKVDSAETHFFNSIAKGYAARESFWELSLFYYAAGEYQRLKALVHIDENRYIHPYLRRQAFLWSLEPVSYLLTGVYLDIDRLNWYGSLAALLISLIWIFYIWRLDVFEREKWYWVAFTFAASCALIQLVYPLTDMINLVGFSLNNSPFNDFMYSFIGIGMVEEFVKMLPVFIMLYWTKQIDEPFDFILYGSVSALGFAFVENIGYIEANELQNISARAFMASVGHMMWTSTICYGLILNRVKWRKNRLVIFLIFLTIASLCHGFYDFWLINGWAKQFSWLTLIFFLASVHVWFVMKNNAINISNYYSPRIQLNNDPVKYFLLVSFLIILSFEYVGQAMWLGASYANVDLAGNVIYFGYFIVYLAFSFSRFEIIHGYLAPIRVPFNFLVPQLLQLPDYSGASVHLELDQSRLDYDLGNRLKHFFPLRVKLLRRRAVSGEANWYVVKLARKIPLPHGTADTVLLYQRDPYHKFSEVYNQKVFLAAFQNEEDLYDVFVWRRELHAIGWCNARLISE